MSSLRNHEISVAVCGNWFAYSPLFPYGRTWEGELGTPANSSVYLLASFLQRTVMPAWDIQSHTGKCESSPGTCEHGGFVSCLRTQLLQQNLSYKQGHGTGLCCLHLSLKINPRDVCRRFWIFGNRVSGRTSRLSVKSCCLELMWRGDYAFSLKDLEAVWEGECLWRKPFGVDVRTWHGKAGPQQTEHLKSRHCLAREGLTVT